MKNEMNTINPTQQQDSPSHPPSSTNINTFPKRRSTDTDSNPYLPYQWPKLRDDETAYQTYGLPVQLPFTFRQIEKDLRDTGSLYVRIITWNQQHAQECFQPNSVRESQVIHMLKQELLPYRSYHILSIGTQECQNSISTSFFFPGKEWWERICSRVLGPEYEIVVGHSLQATHLIVFAHKAIHHLVSHVKSHAVATGIMDTVGNKGGIGISFMVGESKFCFLTAHLAAHLDEVDRRTDEFLRISYEMSWVLGFQTLLESKGDDSASSLETNHLVRPYKTYPTVLSQSYTTTESFGYETVVPYQESRSCCHCTPHPPISSCFRQVDGEQRNLLKIKPSHNPLVEEFDFIFFGGDFNYRIYGSRDIVDTMLESNRHDLLLDHDQLYTLMQFDTTFKGLSEGALRFKPSYKFDVGSDVYDTSRKRRVPAWTDRILHKTDSAVEQLSYSSANNIRLSDHRPVYASYQCKLELKNIACNYYSDDDATQSWTSESKSEVCSIS